MRDIITAENIKKTYKSRRGDHTVLDDLSLHIDGGKLYTIEGESGSGKSTLLSILGGLQKPESGEIVYSNIGIESENGEYRLSELSDDELAVMRRHDIVYVSQMQDVLPTLNVIDNIRLIDCFDDPGYRSDASSEPGDAEDERLDLIMSELGIEELGEEYPSELSGGELRRLCIARALYASPKVILADEPTNDLDKENRDNLTDIFKKITDKGISVVVVTHDYGLAAEADERYVLTDGRLLRI